MRRPPPAGGPAGPLPVSLNKVLSRQSPPGRAGAVCVGLGAARKGWRCRLHGLTARRSQSPALHGFFPVKTNIYPLVCFSVPCLFTN